MSEQDNKEPQKMFAKMYTFPFKQFTYSGALYRYHAVSSVKGLLFIFLFMSCLLKGTVAHAARPELLTSISPQEGSSDETFTFTVTVNNDMTGVAPLLSGGEDFALRLVGPQSSVRIVNGTVSSSVMYIYQLKPKKTGELMTPSAEVQIDGNSYSAPALKVKVTEPTAQPTTNSPPNGKERAFLRQTASPSSVYVGQQIVSAVTLYTRVPLREIELEDATYDDYWQEPFGPEQRSTKHINGYDFTTVQLKRALYPLKVGKLVLPSRAMNAVMRAERSGWPFADDIPDDVFGGLFAGPGKTVTLRSNPVDIEVKPLPQPPPGVPQTTIVGPTSLKLSYSADSIKVGSGKSIEVEVTSEGNLNPLKNLIVDAGQDVKVYEERPEIQHDTRSTVLINRKTFRYSFVPLRPGLIKVAPITLTYFDAERGVYETASTAPIAFPAEGEAVVDTAQSSQQNRPNGDPSQNPSKYSPIPTLAPLELSDTPITPYEEPSFLQKLGQRIPLSVALLICAGVILLAIATFAFVSWRRRVKPKKVDYSRVRNANDIRQLNDAIRSFISSKFSIGGNHLTSDELRQALAKKGFPPEFTFEVGSLLDEFDLLLYSGSAQDDSAVLESLRERSEALIKRTG